MPSTPCRTWFLALPLLATLTVPAVASASAEQAIALEPDATAPSSEEDDAATGEDEQSSSWGRIVGACLGILFGGGLALWQIRGMRDRS